MIYSMDNDIQDKLFEFEKVKRQLIELSDITIKQ